MLLALTTAIYLLALVPDPLAARQVGAPKSQVPDRGRPTTPADEMPLFDFDRYFSGAWTFEWDVPEGVLGPFGTMTGRTIYRHLEGQFYEAETQASGPEGPFTIRELIAYQKEAKTATRYVTDSRGFSYLQTGSVGGDLGGYYSFHFTSAPFTHRGKSIRIKNTLYLVSPAQYKHTMTVSIDGGPFTNYGNAWWQKDLKGATGRR
jgi:hypothetical protein